MDIKILIATHKSYWMPDDPVYLPLHVGAEGKAELGYTRDNTGDHISSKNKNFCELTGLYWAWKNLDADYIGLVHYRRYFTRKEVHNIEKKKSQILTKEDWENLLSRYPVIVPDKRKYYIESNRSHYNHAHHPEGLNITEQILIEKYPEYLPAFNKVMNRTWAHMFNMFIMRRDLFNDYMTWMFDVLLNLKNESILRDGILMNHVSTALSVNCCSIYGLKRITPSIMSRMFPLWKNKIGSKKAERF
ncbi:DUF4422 domain-containing protein [Acidaminococcus intestini]|nr:DUF4422 domain-containing protein [Acidaminococcus intestini]